MKGSKFNLNKEILLIELKKYILLLKLLRISRKILLNAN